MALTLSERMTLSQKTAKDQPDDLNKEREQLKSLLEKAKNDTESEKIFSVAFKLSPNALILSLKSDGTIVETNEGFTALFGYEREEAIGKTSLSLNIYVHPEDRNTLVDLVTRQERLLNYETHIRKKSGEICPVLLSTEILQIGNVETLLATVQDISGLKKTQEALRKSNEAYQQLVQSANSIIIRWDTNGNLKFINNFGLSFFGYQFHEMIGQDVRMLTPEKETSGRSLLHLVEDIVNVPAKYEKFENENIRKNGERVWISWTNKAIYDEYGKVTEILAIGNDITDLKRAENNLKLEHEEKIRLLDQERELFEGIVDHIPIMISIYDPDFSYFRFNKEFRNILGWTEADASDGTFMEKAYPDPDYRKEVAEFMKSLEFGWKEWKVTASNGSIVDSLWANVFLSSGVQIGIGIDIREQKRSDEKIRENEQRLQGIFDNAALGIVETDNSDRFVRVNNRICQILGYAPDELIGKTITEITYPPDRPDSILQNSRLQQGETNMFTYEKRYMKKDGAPLWVRISVSSILDNNGKYLKSIGTIEDISETRKAIEALKESEKKFRSLFVNITEGVALYEVLLEKDRVAGHKIIEVNPAYEKYTGLNAAHLADGEVLTEEQSFFEDYYKVAMTGKPCRFEMYLARTNKHLIINVISPRHGQFATVFEDISELKKIETEIKRKNDELTQFIYTVSHDLKSPLVTIKSFSDFLMEDSEKMDKAAQDKDIMYIQNAAEKMGRLLDELLEISRIGRREEPKSEISLDKVIHGALDLVAGIINKKNVKVLLKGTELKVYGNFQRLVQLYQNLIDNAAKFMGNQTDPQIEIGTAFNSELKDLVFYVRDNGQGIDPRHKHKIFGMFEKVDTASEGTGIGLAVVKKIIELHGGIIWVESQGPGHGTEFNFTLGKPVYNKN